MSRHVVKSISEQDTKKPQISLPVSNENIVHLDRRLRSDKPDVHYFITSPLSPRDLGVEFAQPTALTVTPNSTFGAVGGQEQIIDSPHRAEEEEEEEVVEEESHCKNTLWDALDMIKYSELARSSNLTLLSKLNK